MGAANLARAADSHTPFAVIPRVASAADNLVQRTCPSELMLAWAGVASCGFQGAWTDCTETLISNFYNCTGFSPAPFFVRLLRVLGFWIKYAVCVVSCVAPSRQMLTPLVPGQRALLRVLFHGQDSGRCRVGLLDVEEVDASSFNGGCCTFVDRVSNSDWLPRPGS